MTGAAPARAAPADATAPEVWWWGEGEKGGESGHCGGGDGIGAGGGATAGSCTVAGLEAAPRRFIAATTMTSTAAGGAEVLGCRRGRGAAAWCLAPVVSGYGTSAMISAIIDLYCVLKRCVTAAPVDVSRGTLSRGVSRTPAREQDGLSRTA